MFTRYLGGGIGHLEQFTLPPEDIDDENATTYLNDNKVELDNLTLDENNGSGNYSGEEDSEEGGDSEDDEEDEGDEDEEDGEGDLDEEAGNVY